MKSPIKILFIGIAILITQTPLRAQLRPHPENAHYLEWNNKPLILIGASDHYGSVMNEPFDYVTYLNHRGGVLELKCHQLESEDVVIHILKN